MITFDHELNGVDCEIECDGYEYSPEINVHGFEEISATRSDTGEVVELTEEQIEELHTIAIDIVESDDPLLEG